MNLPRTSSVSERRKSRGMIAGREISLIDRILGSLLKFRLSSIMKRMSNSGICPKEIRVKAGSCSGCRAIS